jgi:hypothetical protein
MHRMTETRTNKPQTQMKYQPSISTIQAFWPKPSAMAAAILLLTAPAFQGFSQSTAPGTLVLTENSSASLTVTLDGNPVSVTTLGTDHWSFTLPFGFILNGEDGEASWAEPDGSGTYNDLVVNTAPTASPAQLEVFSDAKPGGVNPLVGNGVVVPGGDVTGDIPINVTFFDNGDGPGTGTVPDGASTALLALPAILALFAMARLRKSSIPV